MQQSTTQKKFDAFYLNNDLFNIERTQNGCVTMLGQAATYAKLLEKHTFSPSKLSLML